MVKDKKDVVRSFASKAEGGAGSRGGRVVGTTRSGAPVYEKKNAAPKTRLGMVAQSANHAYAAEGHRFAAENHTRSGNIAAAAASKKLAQHHEDRAQHYSQMASQSRRAARMKTTTVKGVQETFPMNKANELDGIDFSEGALHDAQGQSIETDPSSITELQQVIADFEAAGVGSTQGARIVELANSKDVGDGVPAEANVGPWTPDTGGNAPTLPFGQTINISMEKSMPLPGVGLAASAVEFFTSGGRSVQGASRRDN